MIIQVRGSSGSGKSYIGFNLLERYGTGEDIIAPPQTKYNPKRKTKAKIIGHVLKGDLALLGTYRFEREKTYSGGLEAWVWKGSAQDMRDFIAEQARQHRHVVFEGLLPSMAIKPYLELARTLTEEQAKAIPFVFAFMNTPWEVCLQRIYERNGGKEIDLDVVQYTWKRLHKNVKAAYDESEFDSPYIPYDNSVSWIEQTLALDGWNPD